MAPDSSQPSQRDTFESEGTIQRSCLKAKLAILWLSDPLLPGYFLIHVPGAGPLLHSLTAWTPPLVTQLTPPCQHSLFSATVFFCHTHGNQQLRFSIPKPGPQGPQREVSPLAERCHHTSTSLTQKGCIFPPTPPRDQKPAGLICYRPSFLHLILTTEAPRTFPLHSYSKPTSPRASPATPYCAPRSLRACPLCSHTHHAVYLPHLSLQPLPQPTPHLATPLRCSSRITSSRKSSFLLLPL